MVGFSSVSLFPARKREAFTQGGTRGIDHPTRRITQGAGIIKSWENKRERGRIPDTFLQNKNNAIAGPRIPNQ